MGLVLAAWVAAADDGVDDRSYRLGPGDVLHVQVYGEPGLTGQFPVNDAGALDFPLLGSVSVGGKTASEAAADLRDRLKSGYIRDPNVTAWLDSYQSQPVQVLGAVENPGLYYLRGETTVLELLGEAGGVNTEGVEEIRVTHGASEDDVTLVVYRDLVATGAGNLVLSGGDIVFVPESQVTIMGNVQSPGDLPLREGLTVATAIAAAGGGLDTASLSRVFVLRGEERIRVNVRKVQSGKAADLELQPGDRVFVGESVF